MSLWKPFTLILTLICCSSCTSQTKSEFYDNGNTKLTYSLRDGKKHGEAISYYPTGDVESEGMFYRGQFDGEWKFYYESGDLKSIQEYDNGMLKNINFWDLKGNLIVENGTGRAFEEYSNGNLEIEQNYFENKLNGESRTWFQNGIIESVTYFFQGNPCGTWLFYDSTGVLQHSINQSQDCPY